MPEINPGDKVGVVGCVANLGNKLMELSGCGIPGIPVNDWDGELTKEEHEAKRKQFGHERNDYLQVSLLAKAIDDALAAATGEAEKGCGCCKSILVRVICMDDDTIKFDGAELRKQAKILHPDTSLIPKCGKEFKYDCAKQEWN